MIANKRTGVDQTSDPRPSRRAGLVAAPKKKTGVDQTSKVTDLPGVNTPLIFEAQSFRNEFAVGEG